MELEKLAEQSNPRVLRLQEALLGSSTLKTWNLSSASNLDDSTSWPKEVYLPDSVGTGPRGSEAAGSTDSSSSAVAAIGTEGFGSEADGSQLAAVSPSFASSFDWLASRSCSAGSRIAAVAATTG